MAKSGLDHIRDASELRRIAGTLAKSDKAASDALKREAHNIVMRGIKRLRTRVPKRKNQGVADRNRGSRLIKIK